MILFLKSYDTMDRKRFFPYEWLDKYSKLQYSQLPSYDAFYSKLKGANTLEIEYKTYENLLLKHDNNVEKSLKIMKLNTPPKSGLENYTDLKVLWKENNWTSVRDLLIMYLDVLPFVEALLKMLNNKFFGAVECDLTVPKSWSRNDTSPYEYFSEFVLYLELVMLI